MAGGFVHAARRIAAAHMSGYARTGAVMAHYRTQVGSLVPPPGPSEPGSSLIALDEDDPASSEHRDGQASAALLFKE